MRDTGEALGGFLLFAVIVVALSLLGLGIYWFTAPRYTQIQNTVFHNSQQYNDGMNIELEHYRESYAICSTKSCRDAIRSIVVEEYAPYPESKLNPDLIPFLDQMRSGL
jgi:hypothetical protein